MHAPNRQLGMGVFAWIFVLALIGFAAAVLIRLTPHFLDHQAILNSVQNIDAQMLRGPRTKVYDNLKKRFLINNVRHLQPKDIIAIEQQRDQIILTVAYEVKEPLLLNVGMYVDFNEQIVRSVQ